MSTVDVQNWAGLELVGQDDERLGTISHIFVDPETGRPAFASVKTGMFGMRSSLVPITGANRDGEQLRVPYTKDQVKGAPSVADDEELSAEEERRLYEHYNLGYGGSADLGAPVAGARDTSGRTAEDAMTRSEEELQLGTRMNETGRARLRKYVVTEEVNTTVPVSHEEARIEREPITDANRDAAMSGPEISEQEHEVVLHAEEPVVEKRVVPKERVRLETETIAGEAPVSDSVRKEQIEAEGDVS